MASHTKAIWDQQRVRLALRPATPPFSLQIIADVNTGEQITNSSIYKFSEYIGQPIFANQLTDGLRFYVHIPRDLPHLVGDGVSVTPGALIYSSITPQQARFY